jgi:phosphoglycolate phosphatase
MLGLPPMPEDYDWNRCIGPLLEYSLGVELGVPEERLEEAKRMYRSTYPRIGIDGSELYDGMLECVERLIAGGVKVGVASSKTQTNLDATLAKDGITDLFTCVVGPTPEIRYTKAETILISAERTGIPKERILLVGDTRFDAIGAKDAGVDFFAALWGFGKEAEFEEYPLVCKGSVPTDVADFVLA